MSNTIKDNWKVLSGASPASIEPAIELVHRGSQFISMVGKFYIENQPDDSHTNMEWLDDKQVLAGNWAGSPKGNFRFAIRPKDLTLVMHDQDMKVVDECALNGLTNSQILDWVKIHLIQFDVDADLMKLDLHYDIPHHPTDDGAVYTFENSDLFEEAAKWRANSDILLKHFAKDFETASTVRTWPHHFDHGTYIPMVFDDGGNAIRSFSLGYAIADSVIDEPYFYITQWSANKDIDYANLESLTYGNWFPETLGGAALRISDVLKASDSETQIKMLSTYFEEGIAASLKLI